MISRGSGLVPGLTVISGELRGRFVQPLGEAGTRFMPLRTRNRYRQ